MIVINRNEKRSFWIENLFTMLITLIVISTLHSVDGQESASFQGETVHLPSQLVYLGPIMCDPTHDQIEILEHSIGKFLSGRVKETWSEHRTGGKFLSLEMQINSASPISRNDIIKNSSEGSHRKIKQRNGEELTRPSPLVDTTTLTYGDTLSYRFDTSISASFDSTPPSSEFLSSIFQESFRNHFHLLVATILEEEIVYLNNDMDCFSSLQQPALIFTSFQDEDLTPTTRANIREATIDIDTAGKSLRKLAYLCFALGAVLSVVLIITTRCYLRRSGFKGDESKFFSTANIIRAKHQHFSDDDSDAKIPTTISIEISTHTYEPKSQFTDDPADLEANKIIQNQSLNIGDEDIFDSEQKDDNDDNSNGGIFAGMENYNEKLEDDRDFARQDLPIQTFRTTITTYPPARKPVDVQSSMNSDDLDHIIKTHTSTELDSEKVFKLVDVNSEEDEKEDAQLSDQEPDDYEDIILSEIEEMDENSDEELKSGSGSTLSDEFHAEYNHNENKEEQLSNPILILADDDDNDDADLEKGSKTVIQEKKPNESNHSSRLEESQLSPFNKNDNETIMFMDTTKKSDNISNDFGDSDALLKNNHNNASFEDLNPIKPSRSCCPLLERNQPIIIVETKISLAQQDSLKKESKPWTDIIKPKNYKSGNANIPKSPETTEKMKPLIKQSSSKSTDTHVVDNVSPKEEGEKGVESLNAFLDSPWYNNITKLPYKWDPNSQDGSSQASNASSSLVDSIDEIKSLSEMNDTRSNKTFQIGRTTSSVSSTLQIITDDDFNSTSASTLINRSLASQSVLDHDSFDDIKSTTAEERKKFREAEDELFQIRVIPNETKLTFAQVAATAQIRDKVKKTLGKEAQRTID